MQERYDVIIVGGGSAGCAAAMRLDQRRVNHGADVFVRQLFDLHHLVGGAKSVEDMQERNPRLKRAGLGDKREIHRLLH